MTHSLTTSIQSSFVDFDLKEACIIPTNPILLQAKLKDVEQAQQKSFDRIKQLYKKEDARKFFYWQILVLKAIAMQSVCLNKF